MPSSRLELLASPEEEEGEVPPLLPLPPLLPPLRRPLERLEWPRSPPLRRRVKLPQAIDLLEEEERLPVPLDPPLLLEPPEPPGPTLPPKPPLVKG